MNCAYCGKEETAENPVKGWAYTGEQVCYGCRSEFLEEEFFPKEDNEN